jgi:hypothetical protein
MIPYSPVFQIAYFILNRAVFILNFICETGKRRGIWEMCTILDGIGKNLSDKFSIENGLKQGDALSPLLFNFALE